VAILKASTSFLVLLKRRVATMETRQIQLEWYESKELNNILGSWKLVQFNLDDLLLYLFQGARHDRRIPSAHESRERLRNSDIFKRKLDEPNEENQK